MSLFQRTFHPLRTSTQALKPFLPHNLIVLPILNLSIPLRPKRKRHQYRQPDRDAKIDHHKKDSLEKQKAGSGEWKPELASNSEQGVAADKHDLSMEEMQKMGEKKGEEDK